MQKILLPIICSLALSFCQGQPTADWLIPFNAHHQWGFATPTGQMVIPPQFDSVGLFEEGVAEAYRGDKVGLIDTKGQWLVPPRFSFAKPLSLQQKLFDVSIAVTDKEGFNYNYSGIYQQGKGLITPLRYHAIKPHQRYLYALEGMDGHNYLMDIRTGKIKRFHNKHYFDCGCGRAYDEMHKEEVAYQRYLKKKGPLEALNILHYTYENGKMGGYYIYDTAYDYKAKQWVKYTNTIPAIYDTLLPISHFREEFFLAKLNNRWGIVNNAGKKTIPTRFDKIIVKNSEGYVAVKEKGKWGVYTINGQPIFDCAYDSVIMPCNYYDFFFAARQMGQWAIKNKRGQLIAKDSFDRIWFCDDHTPYASLSKNNRYGLLDTSGRMVEPMVYEELRMKDSFLVFKAHGHYGVKDIKNNRLVMAPEWERINHWSNSYFVVGKNGIYGVFLPQAKDKNLFFPIANSDDIEVMYISSLQGDQPFTAFGVTKNGQYYYVGENGTVFKAQ
jgi:hypothetical protein